MKQMKQMKKFSILFLILPLVLMACGGKSSDANAGTVEPTAGSGGAKSSVSGAFKIGFATREITNDFNRNIIDGARNIIEAAGGTMIVADANTDVQKHNENIENLINSGIDGLLIELGDVQQLAPIMARAQAKGIPVVTTAITAHVPGTLTDVCGDSPMLGTLATEALLASVGYQGDIYVVWVPGAPLLESYKRMFSAIVAGHPGIRVHEVPAEHNPGKVQSQIEDILTANPRKGSIAGIFSAYDMLISAGNEAIRRAGRDEIKLVSIDGDRIGFQMLFQEGSPFIATVIQDSKAIGKTAGELIVGVLNGSVDPASIPAMTFVGSYVATRKNGVAAAELIWGESFWSDTQIDKNDVIARYPQTEPVLELRSVVP
jgi:ABC-type sugar transport system substrate-binding protein